jgi:hypothetical protein
MLNKDVHFLAEAYSKILGEATPSATDNIDNPEMEKVRAGHLEKAENYMFVLKSKGFKQVESGGSLNKFVRGKDVVTVDKDLTGKFVVTVNGVTYKGDLNNLHKVTK